MSVDRSLKTGDALMRHRNVLTRAERIEALAEEGRWEEDKNSVFGLPKVTHRKVAGKKKKPAKEEIAEETTETAEATTQADS